MPPCADTICIAARSVGRSEGAGPVGALPAKKMDMVHMYVKVVAKLASSPITHYRLEMQSHKSLHMYICIE